MKKEFPDKRTLIIFTGGPGTGKSGTAERFLKYLDNDEIVKISFDKIKEKNWDIFGFDNEAQKARLNCWCLEEFYLTIQKRMWENKTILIEYPFYQIHKPKLEELIQKAGYSAVTIYLYSDMQTVYRRGADRDQLEGRHPGHLLNQYHIETYNPELLNLVSRIAPTFEEFTAAISHKAYNIELGLDIPVDVTDFSKISYEEIYQKIVAYQKGK
ncbi:zeta toxin family protein [Faecalicatena contorta]|uniref:UDP-N-acetylglucosamine kinase n=1 Tax=Faecalicatena contorta TaxID=39482 RepID=A0A316A0S4_9FIRM|nr:zeta toxin family protein [Faecalicatena contorta]PWJ51285.1 zeta toxin [Faecalicatena contorta]SUQ12841.1 Zeta toxin [Faecalicatena contorta]